MPPVSFCPSSLPGEETGEGEEKRPQKSLPFHFSSSSSFDRFVQPKKPSSQTEPPSFLLIRPGLLRTELGHKGIGSEGFANVPFLKTCKNLTIHFLPCTPFCGGSFGHFCPSTLANFATESGGGGGLGGEGMANFSRLCQKSADTHSPSLRIDTTSHRLFSFLRTYTTEANTLRRLSF